MTRLQILLALFCAGLGLGSAQADNLLVSGDFQTLEPWKANEHLEKHGKITLLPKEQGVTLYNPVIDLDSSLYQDVATDGQEQFTYSARIRGGGMMRASLAFVSMNAAGEVLAIVTPTKVQGGRWASFSGTLHVPPGATRLRTVLSVLDGQCTFANLELSKAGPPRQGKAGNKKSAKKSAWGQKKSPSPPAQQTKSVTTGQGFAVTEMPLERPLWELFCDDLNGDGNPEIVGCDVDGTVTVRNEGKPAFLTWPAGALVYQFAAADFDGDGTKEILLSSMDPKIPVRAINLKGTVLRTFDASRGPERLDAADMDGDGKQEVAVSVGNGIPGSGLAAGIVMYDHQGQKLWEKNEILRTFQFGRLAIGQAPALIVGGRDVAFAVYDKSGNELRRIAINGGLLEQFQWVDVDGDRSPEILASYRQGNELRLVCRKEQTILWEVGIPSGIMGGTGTDSSAWHVCGDFDLSAPGKETVVVATHGLAMFDAQGCLIYQGRSGGDGPSGENWAPGGIHSMDIAFWDDGKPHLYLSSSRFRHHACYRLAYGGPDQFAAFDVPDQEKHLEEIYASAKQQVALPAQGSAKVKVFMAMSEFARASASELKEYRAALDAMETPSLEYLAMYEASDLLGHERGFKLTTDQIVERAAMLEKARIPFGYFAAHGGQVMISRDAIRRSKEAAPAMFRFIYIAENLETLYSPLYKDVLKWTAETLDFCAAHGMKMIFKEKHDVWGLLPSDPEVSRILFSPANRNVTVPIWSTNQPYQPEVQLGGMLGLKLAGYCQEFGMSTQYWNWHEWGRYPRGIRDVSATYVCPSDIMLRLELLGLALGGTWVHVEGGQPYLRPGLRTLVPTAIRHRELAYELIRKNIIAPGTTPANISKATVVRSFHPELLRGKAEQRKVAYPYYDRNTEGLRKGFIPARYLFETYDDTAFPWLAYAMDWNVRTCFPQTPNGWLPVLPPEARPLPGRLAIETDGERVRLDGQWKSAESAAPAVAGVISRGAEAIALQAPGTCLILQPVSGNPDACVAILIDPGYLAPTGVNTTVTSKEFSYRSVTDLVSGARVAFAGRNCPVQIQPGAFRILKFELNQRE